MKKYFIFLIFIIQGCDMSNKNEIENFNSRVSSLLGKSNSVEIVASQLTSFSWDSLCFKREDFVVLTFLGGGSKVELKFSYEDYFIDEPYVDGSLDGVCISGQDHILIKRKFPGYSQTIEFLAVSK